MQTMENFLELASDYAQRYNAMKSGEDSSGKQAAIEGMLMEIASQDLALIEALLILADVATENEQ